MERLKTQENEALEEAEEVGIKGSRRGVFL